MSLPTSFFIGRGGGISGPFPLNLSFASDVRSHLTPNPQGSSILDTVGTASLAAVNTTGLSTGYIDTQTSARTGSSVQRSIRGEWAGYVDTDLTGSTTQSYWVYMHEDSSSYWMFYAGAGLMHMYNANTTYRIGGNGDEVGEGVTYGHYNINTTGPLWQTGVWQHYTWVTSAQGEISTTVYKNGQQVAYQVFDSYDGNSLTRQFLRLGVRNAGSSQYAEVSLDDILVIDKALTSTEVTELYQAALADF